MSKILSGLILVAGGAWLTGCAGSLTTSDGARMRLRSDAFADYAERVFRFQNEVLDGLAFTLDERPGDVALIAVEDDVLVACAGLNDIAVRRQRGEGTRRLRDARTARRVPECEAAAQAAEQALDATLP